MRHATTLVVGLAVLMVASGAQADWNPGDPFKMLKPQLPDPDGWDVAFIDFTTLPQMNTLADDFLCTQTGPISDIHFWISFQGEDWSTIPEDVGPVTVGLWSDDPGDANRHSQPKERLWVRNFSSREITLREPEVGDQGFYNPATGQNVRHDHQLYYQINITDILDPYTQREGTTYWLSLDLDMATSAMPGWKTSQDHWNDDAVWGWTDPAIGVPVEWHEIRDPLTNESLDLAFVITPEPATLALMGLGAAALVARRRRRQA